MRTHDQIVHEIQARAKARGLLSHYCQNSLHCQGSPGLPDLLLVGPYGVAWLEIKTGHDNPSPAQTTWLYALRAAGERHVYMIRERDLDGGMLDSVFRMISGLPSQDFDGA